MDKYKVDNIIGEGAFGQVFLAHHIENGRAVALKKIRINRLQETTVTNAIREVESLRRLSHPHIIHLFDIFPHGSGIMIATQLMHTDLAQVLRSTTQPLPEEYVKHYLRMALHGLQGCHTASIMHRDIKPSNLLLTKHGHLRLGDFGLARTFNGFEDGHRYSHQVATRWYRAPELLFGARQYDMAVDIWSLGVVFGEMINHCTPFPGENDIVQLHRIIKVLGTPGEKNWPGIKELPDWHKISFAEVDPMPFNEAFPEGSSLALDLLSKMLVYDPSQRLTATEALEHPFFFSDPLPECPPDSFHTKRDQISPDITKVIETPFELQINSS
eukprot:gb/GECH01008855.1/.p1 GENE.gb/GECH01008855.1/~~gb/GECH01008855.1/.p1  ORF type:complete len:328 (+),score=78.82 gb/GECH01008855.1/:1-984(+)